MIRRTWLFTFRWSVVLILLAVFCLYPQMSFATAPKDIKLEYDASTQTLTVTITHKSIATDFHYIKYVEIKKNGAEVSKNKYDSQPDPETFTYKYNVPAADGDTIEVTGTCSLFGSKTVTLTIGKPTQ
ncbi:MAG TPA: hypothetical protein VEF33_05230 [Syntrophales bacterium]|nr:hypothetical protein [Syntrophales bacterium]